MLSKVFKNDFDRLEKIFHSISFSIVVKDRNNNIIQLNQYAAQTLNLDHKSFQPTSSEALFGPEVAQKIYEDDLKIIQTKQPILGRLESVELDGNVRWVKTDKVPQLDENNEVENIIIVVQDITDQIEAEKQAFQLKRLADIGIQAAEIVHNLKNPLASAVASASFIEKNTGPSKYIENLKRSHKRMLDIISEILKATKNRDKNESPNTHLVDTINEALKAISAQKDRKVYEYVKVNIDDSLWVKITFNHLQQILSNLLNNAVEELYHQEKRQIQLTSINKDHFVEIRIRDNGRGIPKENIEKIFEPQYSTKKEQDESISGTGLGLSFVKRMTELYGGKVSVISDIGKGSTFIVTLPKGEMPQVIPPASAA